MKSKQLQIIAHQLVKHRKYFFVGVLLLEFFLASFIRLPEIEQPMDGFGIETNPFYLSGKKIASYFDVSDFVELKIEPNPSASTKDVFEGIKELEDELTESIEGASVNSLHQSKRLFRNEIKTNIPIDSTLRKASEIPVVDNLIAKDKTSFLFILKLDSTHNFNLQRFNNIVKREYKGINKIKSLSHFHIEEAITKTLQRDIILLSFVILVLFSLIVFYAFRDIKALIYTLIIILFSIIPTLSLLSILHININLITALSIPVVLILSLADAIHLLSGYYQSNRQEKDNRLEESIIKYILPSFFTSLTTSIAFSSFLLSDIPNIRDFGIIISISVMVSFGITFLSSPYLISHITPRALPQHFFVYFLTFLDRNKKSFAYAFIIFPVLALFLHKQLKFNTDFDSFVPENTESFVNKKEFISNFDSQLSITLLLIKRENATTQKNKAIKKEILQINDELASINNIGTVKSIAEVDALKKRFGVLGNFIKISNKRNPYKNKDGSAFRFEIRLKDLSKLDETYQKITGILHEHKNNFEYSVFSKALLINDIDRGLAKSLFQSVLFSLLFIFIAFLVFTQSLRITFISLLVNLIPLSSIVVLFYLFDLDLNILSAVISVVCLGLIVDDTIHIVYRKSILKENTPDLGFGIVATSLVLILGFITFALSDFIPVQVFGLVSSAIFFITLIADLTLLPFLLEKFKR